MGRVGQPLATSRFIEDKDVEWSATAPRGLDYWRALSGVVNSEPVREVDKAWMAMLLPLGIEKGKTFDPDARQQTILLKGAAMGELMARNLQVNPRFAEPYWPGTSWYKSFDFSLEQETDTRVELDERVTRFYEAVASSDRHGQPHGRRRTGVHDDQEGTARATCCAPTRPTGRRCPKTFRWASSGR